MGILFPPDEFQKLKQKLTTYKCALQSMQTRLDVLLNDFKNIKNSIPIEHIKSRLKSPESIAEKLNRLKFDITTESALKNITDIAGLRCICLYAADIQKIINALKRQPDIEIIKEKDYVTKPKPSGYRSHHIVFNVPVHMVDTTEYVPVEIQVRTPSMDFWATIEHTVRYKYKEEIPEHLSEALYECAGEIEVVHQKMNKIRELIDVAYNIDINE